MNGMVVDSWQYVVGAYAVTWAVLIGYTIRLYRMKRRHDAAHTSSRSLS